MSDYKRQLDEAKRSLNVHIHRFRLQANEEGSIHLFLEGNRDRIYYLPPVTRRGISRPFLYEVGPRNKVLQAVHLAEKTRNFDQAFFFVDRDYNGLLEEDERIPARTFRTDYYSVESYLCEWVHVANFIFGCHGAPNKYHGRVQNNFKTALNSSRKGLNTVSALMIYCRKNKICFNANNLSISSITTIVNGDDNELLVSFPDDLKDIVIRRCNVPPDQIDMDAVNAIMAEIEDYDARQVIRGKYLFELVVKIIKHIGLTLENEKRAGNPDLIDLIPFSSFDEDRLFNAIHTVCPEPDSLSRYFDRHLVR